MKIGMAKIRLLGGALLYRFCPAFAALSCMAENIILQHIDASIGAAHQQNVARRYWRRRAVSNGIA